MKKLLIVFIIAGIGVACSDSVPCRDGLEKRPMYGKVQKCKQQVEQDNQFIEVSANQYGSREKASEAMVRFAWKHYAEGNLDASMERFNQGWLLDSLNYEVYIGFANILSDRGEFEEALPYAEKSVKLNPESSDNWQFLGATAETLYFQTKDEEYLSRSIEYLRKSISIDPENAMSYSILTEVYNLSNQNDSARKYMEIADRLNPELISQELRQKIME